jgi:hypothetical protein
VADDDDGLFVHDKRLPPAKSFSDAATASTAASLRRGLFSYGRMDVIGRISTSMVASSGCQKNGPEKT